MMKIGRVVTGVDMDQSGCLDMQSHLPPFFRQPKLHFEVTRGVLDEECKKVDEAGAVGQAHLAKISTALSQKLQTARRYARVFQDGALESGEKVDRAAALERLLENVFEIGLELRKHPTAQKNSEILQLRVLIAETLMSHAHWLKSYVQDTLSLFSTATQGGEWAKMSQRRSSLAFLQDFASGTTFELGAKTLDLSPIDDLIFNMGESEGYLSEADVPTGVPETHWWWWYPDNPR